MAETIDYDRLDSGMGPEDRGTPYTIEEAKAFIGRVHYLDPHAVELMRFLIRRVERLEQANSEDKVYKAFLRAKETSPEPDCILVPNPDGAHVRVYPLNNNWQVVYKPENLDEFGVPFNLDI